MIIYCIQTVVGPNHNQTMRHLPIAVVIIMNSDITIFWSHQQYCKEVPLLCMYPKYWSKKEDKTQHFKVSTSRLLKN